MKDDEETVDIKYFNTQTAPIYSTTDLNEWFVMNVQQPIDTEMEEFQGRESGWSLKSILNLVVNVYKYNPMRGSSFIVLPPFIKNKKACVNVNNDDDQCFRWAILSALHPASININRVSSYVLYKDELNFEGIEFPVDPRKIEKFETQNDVSVNVYYFIIDCEQINQYKITLPSKKDSILQFKNFGCKNRVRFVIYADFECILKPVTENERAYQSHKPFSVGFFDKCSYNNSLSEYKSYRQEGEDAESPAKWFVQSLHSLAVILSIMLTKIHNQRMI